MTIQKLIKAIENLNDESPQIISLKEMATELSNKISKANQNRYNDNLELSRLKRSINNSKQAIKKHWGNRKEKTAYIKKHINILRDIYKNNEFLIKNEPVKKNTDNIEYSTKQSLNEPKIIHENALDNLVKQFENSQNKDISNISEQSNNKKRTNDRR